MLCLDQGELLWISCILGSIHCIFILQFLLFQNVCSPNIIRALSSLLESYLPRMERNFEISHTKKMIALVLFCFGLSEIYLICSDELVRVCCFLTKLKLFCCIDQAI